MDCLFCVVDSLLCQETEFYAVLGNGKYSDFIGYSPCTYVDRNYRIDKRIHKLDRVLPKKRLLREFGMLALGGITGILITLFGIFYGVLIVDAADIICLLVVR